MPRAPVQTFRQLIESCLMIAEILVLLLPWHLVDLVHCKSLVDVFNTVVDPKKEKFAQRLQLQIAFEEVDHLEEFTNIGLFSKTSVQSSNRNSCANIGRNFKHFGKFTGLCAEPIYLTGKQCLSKEKYCTERGPVGTTMEPVKPGGVLSSGVSYKLQDGAQRNSSAPPASGGSETPSLAGMDSANLAAVAAIDAASPGAVAQRARGFQPQAVFDNRRPALRLALANPAERGRSHDDGGKAEGRGRLMRADNVSAALVAVVWARLLCQDCASVWSLPILSLLSIAEGLLFSVVGCWLECLQKQNWTVVQDEYHLYGVQENGMECCIAEVERVIAKHEIEEILAKEKVREDELCCLQESFKYLHKLDKKNNTIAWGSIADFIIAVAKEMDPEG